MVFPGQGPVLGGGGHLIHKKFAHQPQAIAIPAEMKNRTAGPEALDLDVHGLSRA
jgi:hypothetical protein